MFWTQITQIFEWKDRIMLLSTSYPTWVKILFVIWIIFTLIVVLLLFSYRKKSVAKVSTTPLYEKTEQRIDDFYNNLDREQLAPWLFFNTGKMPEVKKFYGGTIKYSGVEFSGTPVLVFWEGFIEPFLEHGIVEILEQVADEALAKQLDPEPCINKAAGSLNGAIAKTYNRMAEIDQRLRGKGDPDSVKRKDVTEKIEKMRNFLQRHKNAVSEIAASRYQYFLNVESRQNIALVISIMALIASITIPILIALFKR